MAKYPSISQTKNGRILIAKSNATGKALVPIKVVTGDGQLTNQNIEIMENVINPLLELPFASPGRFVKEGQFQLDFALSNEHLEHGFYAREIGVFAKLDGEDDSTAVMIAYTNGGNFVDYIPSKDTPINSKVFEITIAVDNAASVVVQRSDAAYITAGEMERHNTDANAHGGLLQKVKTELATHNTDISSHPAITAMIAKILGATNWQENPVATLKDIKNLLGMGGIVAQRLEENGFVKFANGFTIQWGKSNIAVTRTIYDGVSNFIIPFTFPPFVAVTNIAPATLDNDNWTSSAVKEITINNFTYMSAQNNVTSIRWGAIGF